MLKVSENRRNGCYMAGDDRVQREASKDTGPSRPNWMNDGAGWRIKIRGGD